MKITRTIYTRLFTIFPNLIAKESYYWWVTRRKWGFRHQKSEAKYPKVSVANIQKHSREFRRRTKWLQNFADVQGGCEIILQPKADFAALRNWPSACYDRLLMALTSSFQLRFVHRMKRWLANFPSFETTYGMHQIGSHKCFKSVRQLMSSCILYVAFILAFLISFGKGLHNSKAWILHVTELPFALPWIPQSSP